MNVEVYEYNLTHARQQTGDDFARYAIRLKWLLLVDADRYLEVIDEGRRRRRAAAR
jgi:hypothetical protein